MDGTSTTITVGTGPTLHFLLALLGVVLISELRTRRIPDAACLAAFVAAFARSITALRPPSVILLSALVGLAPLAARGLTRGGIGWGDVKLAVPLALLLGPWFGALGLLLACALGLCSVGLGSLLDPDATYEAGVAFGPYLVAGAIIALFVEASHVHQPIAIPWP